MIAKALGLERWTLAIFPLRMHTSLPEDVGYILALYEEGIISGDPNGNFNPNSAITGQKWPVSCKDCWKRPNCQSPARDATVEQGQSITLKATVKMSRGQQ